MWGLWSILQQIWYAYTSNENVLIIFSYQYHPKPNTCLLGSLSESSVSVHNQKQAHCSSIIFSLVHVAYWFFLKYFHQYKVHILFQLRWNLFLFFPLIGHWWKIIQCLERWWKYQPISLQCVIPYLNNYHGKRNTWLVTPSHPLLLSPYHQHIVKHVICVPVYLHFRHFIFKAKVTKLDQ